MSVVDDHRRAAAGQIDPLHFAVVTVSDTRSPDEDVSGSKLERAIRDAGHVLEERALVRDEVDDIRATTQTMLERGPVQVVMVTGGTGFSPRDVTVAALEPLFSEPIPGFGELFRMLSYAEIGAAAMLSRTCAGLVGEQVVFVLPGSPAAVELAFSKLILPEVGHLLEQVGQMGQVVK